MNRFRGQVVCVALMLACLPSVATAQALRCDIASKFKCDAQGGCQKVAASMWNIVDITQQTLTRCDAKGCDTYRAQFATSGEFVNIALPANGMLAKMSADGSMFLETATLMGTALVSFGACRPQ